jgi:hypothetical protein
MLLDSILIPSRMNASSDGLMAPRSSRLPPPAEIRAKKDCISTGCNRKLRENNARKLASETPNSSHLGRASTKNRSPKNRIGCSLNCAARAMQKPNRRYRLRSRKANPSQSTSCSNIAMFPAVRSRKSVPEYASRKTGPLGTVDLVARTSCARSGVTALTLTV